LIIHVTNGTAFAVGAAPYQVTLQAFNGEVESNRWAVESDLDGTASFDELDQSPGLMYVASSVHRGVRYFADPVSLFDGVVGPVSVTVFEITSDPGEIRISGDNIVVLGPDGDGGTLNVMQVTTVENLGDRTFIGERGSESIMTLQIPLPLQAFDVEALHAPGSLIIEPDTLDLYSTLPTLPGQDDMILTYRLLFQHGEYTLNKKFPYPTDTVRLLIPDGISTDLDAPWASSGMTEVAGTSYETFELAGVEGSELTVSALLTGLPISAGERSRGLEIWFRYGAVVLGVLVAAVAIGYGVVWSRKRDPTVRSDGGVAASPLESPATRSATFDTLAVLDAEFEAGNVTEGDYRTTRAELVQSLRQQLEEGPAS
jgi:hypothetical protein